LHIQVISLCMWRSNYRLARGFKRTGPLGRRKQSTTSLCSHTQAHTGTPTPYSHRHIQEHPHPMHTQAHPHPTHTGTYRNTHTLCTHRHTLTLCTHSLQKNMYKNKVKITQIIKTHVSMWKGPYTHAQSLLQWLKCTMLNQRTEINHKRSLNPAHCIGPSTVPRTVATPQDLNTSNHTHSMTHRHTHTVTHTQTHTHTHCNCVK